MPAEPDVTVVGTGVVGLAVACELLARGMRVAVVGPREGEHRGQGTRAAGAMLSTFSEIEPGHGAERVAVETAERLAAHEAYPRWLERIAAMGGGAVEAPAGTWVLAPAGYRGHLAAIAAAARGAGHEAEEHDDARVIPGLRAPSGANGALWLPSEARVDTAALMAGLTAAIDRHPAACWSTAGAVSVEAGRVVCADGTVVTARQTVLAAGCAIPGLVPGGGREWGLPPILAGRGASALLEVPAVTTPHVVRTPNMAFSCGAHLVPRIDGALYLGGTNRLTLEPDPSAGPVLDELAVLAADAAGLLDPRLGGAGLRAARIGLRPYTLDHLPLIGRTGCEQVLVASATYRCGVLLAPRLAHLVAEEIEAPGALAAHPYRVLRPMPTPQVAQVIADGAAEALVEHLLQGGGALPAGRREELTGFLSIALRALLDEQGPAGAAMRRLWERAPVIEAVPSLLTLARRLEAAR
jgi:glycine/D-amino acid oxidase-like deaminating enzyme